MAVNLLHTYNFIQRVHEPDFAVPKLIKSRKPFFPDMVINIYKTVTQVKYALRIHATLYQGSLEFMTDYHSDHLIVCFTGLCFVWSSAGESIKSQEVRF